MGYIFYCVLRLDFMALYKSYFIVVLLPVYIITYYYHWPSVLWGCWLGDRKGIRPVKNWVVGCWRGYLSERGADLHMTQLMPLPLTLSCFSKIQIGFTFQVPGHPGSLGKRAVKRVCVCIIICGSRGRLQFQLPSRNIYTALFTRMYTGREHRYNQ